MKLSNDNRIIVRTVGDFDLFGTANINFNGNRIYHAGFSGPGSGLNADLLDGQHGAWYADIPSRLGFVPANKAGDTFSGAIKRDPDFYMEMQGSNPIISFDGNDFIQYDRAANKFNFIIGSVVQASIDATGTLRVRGNVIGNTTP